MIELILTKVFLYTFLSSCYLYELHCDWKETVTVNWFCRGFLRVVQTTEQSNPRQVGSERVNKRKKTHNELVLPWFP